MDIWKEDRIEKKLTFNRITETRFLEFKDEKKRKAYGKEKRVKKRVIGALSQTALFRTIVESRGIVTCPSGRAKKKKKKE